MKTKHRYKSIIYILPLHITIRYLYKSLRDCIEFRQLAEFFEIHTRSVYFYDNSIRSINTYTTRINTPMKNAVKTRRHPIKILCAHRENAITSQTLQPLRSHIVRTCTKFILHSSKISQSWHGVGGSIKYKISGLKRMLFNRSYLPPGNTFNV